MSIKLRTEVSLDIDANRKLWVTAVAEDVQIEEVAEVTDSMAGKLIEQTTEAFERLDPVINPEPGPRSLRTQMRTFQEDD